MSERPKSGDVEGAPPVLYIVCSHGHKLRKIAKVIAIPRIDPKAGTYRPGVAAIYIDRRSRDIFEAGRFHAQVGPGVADAEASGDLPPELPAGEHLTYTFRCGARGCSAVTLKEENLARMYAAFVRDGLLTCELSTLAAIVR